MVEKNNVHWNDTYEFDGVLYYLQRVIEMLDYDTIDIFRAPLLNTTRLIDEYLQIWSDGTKQFHRDEIFNELKDSLSNDIIILNNVSEERVKQLVDMLNSASDKRAAVEYLNRSISPNYLKWCEDYLRLILPDKKHKNKIERAIRCYLPELFRYGYNREDIYYKYKKALESEPDQSSKLIEQLINRYNNVKTDYAVYFAISKELLNFKETLENKLRCSFDDDGNFKKLRHGNSFVVVKMPVVKALDVYSAAESALKILDTFLIFYNFWGNYSKNLIQSKALVISDNGEQQVVSPQCNKYNSIEDDNHPQAGELSTLIISNLFARARFSIPELKKILNLHNRAILSNGLENGFLNFWSILEICCVTDENASKINQVIDKLIPILKLKYVASVFEHLSSNLKQILSEEDWQELQDSINDGDGKTEKIAYLVLHPKYNSLLDSFTDKLQSYPVIRSRMLNLHDQYSENKRNLYNNMCNYEKRLSWHLHRIYRARNAITHNGKQPNNIKDLGEHLHAYVDYLMEDILVKLSMGTLCNISNVFIDSKLHLQEIEEYLSDNSSFDDRGISLLFSSQIYCWYSNKIKESGQ